MSSTSATERRATPPPYDGSTVKIRRHWINLVWRAWAPGLLTVLFWLGALLAFLSALGPAPDWGVSLGLGLLVVSVVPAILVGVIYYDWANDYLTITSQEVVYYEQSYIFSHVTQVVPLRQIQNVGMDISNPIYRRLNVGMIIIDTAGQEGAIRFYAVKDPGGIQSQIFELLGRPIPPEVVRGPRFSFEWILPLYPVQLPDGGLMWHRHPFVLARRLFAPMLLSLGMLALFVLWLLGDIGISIVPKAGGAVILALVWIAVSLWSVYIYADWWDDYWIVNDTHIIDVDALPFISEDRRQALLENIQDIRVDVPSFWARIINMGNVFAETAGRAQNFVFAEVMDPNSIREEIFQRRAAARARAAQEAEQAKQVDQEEFQRRVVEMVMERLGKAAPPVQPGSK